MADPEAKLDKEKARQGNSRHMNYRVLIWSTALAALALVAIYLVFNLGGGA